MSDRLKPSRLELRLEAEISGAHSVPEADCKRAELAAYRVRLGRVEEVRATLKELHQRYDARPNVAISAWLNLVEGLARYFSDMDPAARDKVLRAHALSSAAGLTPMRALSAAWLAHLDYAQGDVDSMALHVSEALTLSVETHHGARSRASLVVAQSYHLAGDLDTALPWYVKARDHAQADGDDATISALMHNMAWLRSHELRKRFFLELENDSATEHALLSAESTRNFNILIGSVSLNSLIPVLRAQILAVIGREAEALEIFEQHLNAALNEGMGRLQADLVADMAWCRLKSGQIGRAREDAFAAVACIDPAGQFDDRALAHGRLALIFNILEDFDETARHRRMALEAWAGHALLQRRIVDSLGNIFLIV